MRLVGTPGRTGINKKMYQLQKTARQWRPFIRHSLKKLGQEKWSQPRWASLFPGRLFRMREEVEDDRYVWWIERDIPPVDLYRCAAYQVVLTLGEKGEMNLVVRTGRGDYPVPQPVSASLEKVLQEASKDPALVIARKMGIAYD